MDDDLLLFLHTRTRSEAGFHSNGSSRKGKLKGSTLIFFFLEAVRGVAVWPGSWHCCFLISCQWSSISCGDLFSDDHVSSLTPFHSLNFTKKSNRRKSNGPDKYGGNCEI